VPSGEVSDDGKRSSKKPRVEVSKLASWGTGEQNDEAGRQVERNGDSRENPYLQMLAVRDAKAGDGNSTAPLGRVHIQGSRSKYVGLGDRMALLDLVSCQLLMNFKFW
jgi:hypothetical protein